MFLRFKKKFIGDRAFYRMLFTVAFPVLVQNAITNCVNLLDNMMVGQTGTEPMSGVAIVNTLFFVYEICLFGVISGASIFGAQYFGSHNEKSFRDCFRFKLVYGMILTGIGIMVFLTGGRSLIGFYLRGASREAGASPDRILQFGWAYLKVIMFCMPVFALTQAYASTLREAGQTALPMYAGIAGILVNLVFNYILIFGKLGAPRLGVVGAAVATVLSRIVECTVIIAAVRLKKEKYPWMQNLLRSFRLPADLQARIFRKGWPLMINEAFWAGGQAVLNQCYSYCGLDVVPAVNISSTVSNVFNIFFIAIGSAVSIIVGQLLGAGKMEEARDTDNKLIAASVLGCCLMAVLMIFASYSFPGLYNTEENVRKLAGAMIRINAVFIPLVGFMHACYFTLRSGGKTITTLFFDSVFVWAISIPVALALVRLTSLPVTTVIFLVLSTELIKTVIGVIMLKKGVWLQNLVN